MLKKISFFKYAFIVCISLFHHFSFSQCSATINSTEPTCFGLCDGSITAVPTGGTAPYTYQWVDGTGLPIGNTATINGLCAGNYGVNITDASGVCAINEVVQLIEPAQLILSATTTDASCFGICDGAVEINAINGTSPYTYTWNFGVNGDQSGNATGICYGTYTMDVTDYNGCVESVVYNINQPEDIIFQSIITNNAGCEDGSCEGSIEVSAIGANSYALNGVPNASGSFTGLCPDNYILTAQNDAGCTIEENVLIINEEGPRADFGIINGEMSLPDHEVSVFNNSYNATSYEWIITGPNYNYTTAVTEFSDFELPYQGGNYMISLVAFNATSCIDTMQAFVEVRDEFTIWVPNSFTPDGDEFNNTFHPTVSDIDASSYDLFVFNRWGEVIFESHDPTIGWDGTHNGRFMENGMYVWKIRLKSIYTDELREYSGNVTMVR
ncbi:MAG: gliding motility-associated C-terminal domain-containing protein [Crocinitomicaceae bacterium]|nr:gliding motility-associated C-terminal domain-containing protein [Crocinitomicaceae bacterium]